MAFIYDAEWYVVREGDEMLLSHQGRGEQIAVPIDVFDAIVLMRAAQMNEDCTRDELRAKMVAACDRGTLAAQALRRNLHLPSIMGDL